MRAAFFALLFANLAFMAWAGWVDTPRQAKTTDAASRLPQLKLVSEVSPEQQGGADSGAVRKMAMSTPAGTSAGSQAPSQAPADIGARCVSVGPFNDLAIAAKAAGALHSRGFAPQQRAEEGETWNGFWVYIGGVSDAAEADKAFKTLDRAGIKDAHLMPESNDGRRISVGLFSERDRAERRARTVEKLGFKTEVAERKQPGTVYWVDLALKPSDGAVPVQDLLTVGAGSSRLSVQNCPPNPTAQPAAAPQSIPAERAPPGARVPPNTVAGTPKLP